jgi:heme-degrading monooxygenase HmoA
MHAQVTTIETSPARLDDAIRFFREQVLSQLEQMEGFEEFIALSDRQSGKLLGVVLWENEDRMHSLEEVLSRTRGGISHPLGGAVVGVEHYAVSVFGHRASESA